MLKVNDRVVVKDTVKYEGVVTEDEVDRVFWFRVEKVDGLPIKPGTYPKPIVGHTNKVIR